MCSLYTSVYFNRIQKIPLKTKLDAAYAPVQFWLFSEFFHPIVSKQHVILLINTNMYVTLLGLYLRSLSLSLTLSHGILN